MAFVGLQAFGALLGDEKGHLVATTRTGELQKSRSDTGHRLLVALLLGGQTVLGLLVELLDTGLRLGGLQAVLVEHGVQVALRFCQIHLLLQGGQIGHSADACAHLGRRLLDLVVKGRVVRSVHLFTLLAVHPLNVLCKEGMNRDLLIGYHW